MGVCWEISEQQSGKELENVIFLVLFYYYFWSGMFGTGCVLAARERICTHLFKETEGKTEERIDSDWEERIDRSVRGFTTEALCLMHLPNPHPPGERERRSRRGETQMDWRRCPQLSATVKSGFMKQRVSFTTEIQETTAMMQECCVWLPGSCFY